MSDAPHGPLIFGVPDEGGGTPTTDDACCFVWNPGGTAGGNIFTDWALLVAALALVAGEKTIVIGASASIPVAGMPVGGWNLQGSWLVNVLRPSIVLDTDDGVELLLCYGLKGVAFTSSNTAVPVFTVPPGIPFYVRDGATITSKEASAQPIIQCVGGAGTFPLIELRGGALFGNEDDPVVGIDALTTCILRMWGGGYVDNTISGPGNLNPVWFNNTADRNQPLLTGTIAYQYGLPLENGFVLLAGGVLPLASGGVGNAFVTATGNVSLPEANRSGGPHFVRAFGTAVVVSLANPTNSLNGTVGATFTILEGGYACFTSDKLASWVTSAGGDPILERAQATDDSVLALADAAFTDIPGMLVTAVKGGVYTVNAGANCDTSGNDFFDFRLIAGVTPVDDSLRTLGASHGAGGPALSAPVSIASFTPSVAAGTTIRMQQMQGAGAGTLGVQHRTINIVRIGP